MATDNAGNNSPASTPMIAITVSSSINVKALLARIFHKGLKTAGNVLYNLL